MTDETAVVASTKPRTLAEKLAAAVKLVAKYTAEMNAETIKDDTEVNDAVTFTFGRGEKVRTLAGTVVAVKDDEKQGRLVAILAGEGFDAETFKVRAKDITVNTSADARRAEEAPVIIADHVVDATGLTFGNTDVVAEADPLNVA